MVTKEQLMRAVTMYIDNDMIPKAEGNHKIILRTASAAIKLNPNAIFERLKNNELVAMLGVIDQNGNIDDDMVTRVITDGFGADEFTFSFALFGKEYIFHFSSGDIHSIKKYM